MNPHDGEDSNQATDTPQQPRIPKQSINRLDKLDQFIGTTAKESFSNQTTDEEANSNNSQNSSALPNESLHGTLQLTNYQEPATAFDFISGLDSPKH